MAKEKLFANESKDPNVQVAVVQMPGNHYLVIEAPKGTFDNPQEIETALKKTISTAPVLVLPPGCRAQVV